MSSTFAEILEERVSLCSRQLCVIADLQEEPIPRSKDLTGGHNVGLTQGLDEMDWTHKIIQYGKTITARRTKVYGDVSGHSWDFDRFGRVLNKNGFSLYIVAGLVAIHLATAMRVKDHEDKNGQSRNSDRVDRMFSCSASGFGWKVSGVIRERAILRRVKIIENHSLTGRV
uniref:Uncharacterized protein n=1 Tax=Hyaloperonospora arabidopsidis (strain Emoy2) TaxID=559515 RepID=M4BSM5_HYAAE